MSYPQSISEGTGASTRPILKIRIADCHEEASRLHDALAEAETAWRALTGEQEAKDDQPAQAGEPMDSIAYLRHRITLAIDRIQRLGADIAER